MFIRNSRRKSPLVYTVKSLVLSAAYIDRVKRVSDELFVFKNEAVKTKQKNKKKYITYIQLPNCVFTIITLFFFHADTLIKDFFFFILHSNILYIQDDHQINEKF